MTHHPMDGSSAVQEGRYTVRDYLSWPDSERWELIRGVAYDMSSAPRVVHQHIVGSIYAGLVGHLHDTACLPYVAPIDVYLNREEDGEPNTVVQPDVIVVCDRERLSPKGVHGPPDLVVEVLSDATAYRDLNEKKRLYEEHGVREYWAINPGDGSVFIWIHDGRRFEPGRERRRGESLASTVVDGFVWRFPELPERIR